MSSPHRLLCPDIALVTMVLLVLLALPAASDASPNLLKNPSFEDGKLDWGFLEPGDVVAGSAHAGAGNKCLKITVNPQLASSKGFFRIAQSIKDVKPNETLTLSVWMRTQALQGNGKATVVAKFWIDPKADKFKAYFVPSKAYKGTTPWSEYSGTVVAPPDFNGWLQIVCFVHGCTSGEVFFDDLRFERAGTLPGCTAASDCDDKDPCTTDTCSGGQCQHSAVSGCCTAASQCDDKDPCTADTCSSNTCQHSAVSGCCKADGDCDDKNPCTTDACDAKTGKCSNNAQAGCCAFDTDCDDGDPCTLDRCDPGNTCQHTNICTDAGADSSMPAGDGAVLGDTGAVSGDTGAVAAPDAGPSLEDSSGGSALAPGEETRGLSGGCSMPAASPPWPPLSLVLLGLLVVLRRR